MPAPTSITIIDNASASIVFEPVVVSSKKTTLETKTANTSAGELGIILGFDPRSKKRKSDHVQISVSQPIELGNATDGYTVKDTLRFVGGSFMIPEAATEAQRIYFGDLVAKILSHPIIQGYVDRDPFWG